MSVSYLGAEFKVDTFLQVIEALIKFMIRGRSSILTCTNIKFKMVFEKNILKLLPALFCGSVSGFGYTLLSEAHQ